MERNSASTLEENSNLSLTHSFILLRHWEHLKRFDKEQQKLFLCIFHAVSVAIVSKHVRGKECETLYTLFMGSYSPFPRRSRKHLEHGHRCGVF